MTKLQVNTALYEQSPSEISDAKERILSVNGKVRECWLKSSDRSAGAFSPTYFNVF